MSNSTMDRRSFLRLSGLTGTGLFLSFALKNGTEVYAASAQSPAGLTPNAFLRIAPDGSVSISSHKPEVGQGIRTALPMLVAEELEVDWKSVTVIPGDLDPAYSILGMNQSAGGSNSTPTSYDPLRRMGAMGRTMLVAAAAKTWNVAASECVAEAGFVHHRASGRKAGYGELVAVAATLPAPDVKDVALKDPKSFKLIGQRITGVDNQKIVTGQPLYGIDVVVPGMKHAVYEKCPVFGGKVVSANLEQIKALPGVRDAFIIEGTDNVTGLVPGVAIIADSTWAAISARRQLRVTWDEGKYANQSWAGFTTQAKELATKPGATVLRKDGDVAAALAGAAKVVTAEYSYPFISHANLEPQNCTAKVEGDQVELWAPSQNPASGQNLVAQVLGIPRENVKVHIIRAGGGFGRRLSADFMADAAAIAKRAGVPIKLTWTREDDLLHDHFRPGGFHFLKGGVTADGKIAAWHNHFITFAVGGRNGSGGSLGAAEFPARFLANYQAEQTPIDCNIPMGPWRAPGSCVFSWVFHSFIDELALAAGKDPLQFRLELLGDKDLVSDSAPSTPPAAGSPPPPAPYNAARMRGVVKLAGEKIGWGKRLPKGQGQGIAFHFSHRGYVAIAAEVSVAQDGALKVDRVVAACDVGSQIINPSGAENQIEGSVVDGLSAAWLQESEIDGGRVVQGNFDTYPLLRITEAPLAIESHFLLSDNPPTGLGEPVLPPVAPAVCNAIFAATGKRIRSLPFSRSDLRWT
jgi:isoquinoline 1-oxidoreductase beta subunit